MTLANSQESHRCDDTPITIVPLVSSLVFLLLSLLLFLLLTLLLILAMVKLLSLRVIACQLRDYIRTVNGVTLGL